MLGVIGMAAPAAASTDDGAPTSSERHGSVVLVEATGQEEEPGVGTMATGSATGVGWAVEWKNVISYTVDYKNVNHYFAHSRRTSGSGGYRTHAHSALVRDGYTGTQVFSGYTHACASTTVTNATAKTCKSPWFATSSGKKWAAVSGHNYDHANNGSWDGNCSGCVDFIWTTP